MDSSARSAVNWLKEEIRNGGNPNTLGSYATAIRQVLRVTHGDSWGDQDLAALDLQLHLENFREESGLEPGSIDVYCARFKSATNRFLTHIESNGETRGPRMLDVPYPLRDEVILNFRVPVDLTPEEADRLGAFFRSLSRSS